MSQFMMDQETKTLLEDIQKSMAEGSKVKAAVQQLEEQMKGVPGTIDNKLKGFRQLSFDGTSRYRGLFDSEEQARGFGLLSLASTTKAGWATSALKSEFPDMHKAFTSDDAEALIPEGTSTVLVDLIEQYGVFERNALSYPMSEEVVNYPKKTGRTMAYPVGAGAPATESKPTIAKKTLTARKWANYTEVPSEVEEDMAVPLAELIAADMAEGHALAIDTIGFLGDGTGGHHSVTGVVNALIAQAIVTAGGTTWADITLLDMEKIIGTVTSKAFVGVGDFGPKWYCSLQFFWNVMVPLTLSSGGVTAAEVQGQRKPVFLGFPVEFAQVFPSVTAADQTPCVFGNLHNGAVFGDRRKFSVKESRDFKFDEDVLALLSTRRHDIQVHGAGEGTTPEVFAGIKTAAS